MTFQKLPTKSLADHPVVLVDDVPTTVTKTFEPAKSHAMRVEQLSQLLRKRNESRAIVSIAQKKLLAEQLGQLFYTGCRFPSVNSPKQRDFDFQSWSKAEH